MYPNDFSQRGGFVAIKQHVSDTSMLITPSLNKWLLLLEILFYHFLPIHRDFLPSSDLTSMFWALVNGKKKRRLPVLRIECKRPFWEDVGLQSVHFLVWL